MRPTTFNQWLAAVSVLIGLLWATGCQPRSGAEVASSPSAAAWAEAVPAVPPAGSLPVSFHRRAEPLRAVAVAAGATDADLQAYGELLHASGFFAEAAQCWVVLGERNPREALWPYYIADAYRNTGYEEEAQGWLQQSLTLDADYARGWLRAGDYQLKRGELADARHSYETVLDLDPDNPHGQFGLSQVEARTGAAAQAIERLRRLSGEVPEMGTAQVLLAELLEEEGRSSEAKRFRRLAAGAPRFAEAEDPRLRALYEKSHDPERLVLWGTYARHGRRFDEAVRFFQLAIERAPERSAAYQFLGETLAAKGAPKEAIEILSRGVELADATEAMVVGLVEAQMVAQRLEEALAATDRALERFAESALIMNARGRVLALRGETAAALAAFGQALVWMPHYADPALNQALVHLRVGDRPAAEAAIDEALRRQPAFPRARVLRAEMAMAEGDLMGALDSLQAAYEQSPGVVEVRQALARWFETAIEDRLEAGDRAMAERIARQGGRLMPELAEALMARAAKRE